MGNVQRLLTQKGNPDWHGWLALYSCRSTAFHLAVVIALVVEGALVAAQTGITHGPDHPGMGSEADGHQRLAHSPLRVGQLMSADAPSLA